MTEPYPISDIWPASDRLRKALEQKRTDLITYTMPGIKYVTLFTEPLLSSATLISEQYLSQSDPTMNQQGILSLLSGGHLEAALVATSSLLTQLGQGQGMAGKPTTNSEQIFQLWAIRFQLMLALRKFSQLVEELIPFEELDAPDLYYEYYPGNLPRKGSMIPFSLRLVHAEILRHTPFPWKAAQRIITLENNVKMVIQNFSDDGAPSKVISDWNKRLESVLKLKMRTLYHLEEYNLSMSCAKELRSLASDDASRVVIGCAMVRMAISSGDEKSAEKALAQAAMIMNEETVTLHKAYRTIFHGSFPHAFDYIQRLEHMGHNSLQMYNTNCVCRLYTCKASEAVSVLSQLDALPVPMQTNLATLAELACDSRQKNKILELTKQKT